MLALSNEQDAPNVCYDALQAYDDIDNLLQGFNGIVLGSKKVFILSSYISSIKSGTMNCSWVVCFYTWKDRIKQIISNFISCDLFLFEAIDIECIFKYDLSVTLEGYDLLLKKVELQLEKAPKILEQQKQLKYDSDLYKLAKEILSSECCKTDYETYKNKVEEFEQKLAEFNKIQTLQSEKAPEIREQQKKLEYDSDLYKLADEILGEQIRDADYETYKNKVEEFEREFEKFSASQKLKNSASQLDDEKELHEDEIGNDNDGGTLENENVLEEKSDDSNSECSNGGACSCLKNILWYCVFLYLSLFSLLLLIISIYCLIVTAIFLLASVVLYFIQKTKKDNDDIKSMAEKLSPELNQEQSKNLISVEVDRNRDKSVKQQNKFSLFERANN